MESNNNFQIRQSFLKMFLKIWDIKIFLSMF